MKIQDFSPVCKLKRVLLSILTGCETLTAFNSQLDGEVGLAAIWNWERFADQSTLSLPSKGLLMAYCIQRGSAEVEQFRNDKNGLTLTARRKQCFLAQI